MALYLRSDIKSLEYHRLVVKKLRQDPSLIKKALGNIRRWKKQNQYPQPYLEDWLTHIDKGLDHLCAFLLSETDEAQRLRSSSPFAGILTEDERMKIWMEHHDA